MGYKNYIYPDLEDSNFLIGITLVDDTVNLDEYDSYLKRINMAYTKGTIKCLSTVGVIRNSNYPAYSYPMIEYCLQ